MKEDLYEIFSAWMYVVKTHVGYTEKLRMYDECSRGIDDCVRIWKEYVR